MLCLGPTVCGDSFELTSFLLVQQSTRGRVRAGGREAADSTTDNRNLDNEKALGATDEIEIFMAGLS